MRDPSRVVFCYHRLRFREYIYENITVARPFNDPVQSILFFESFNQIKKQKKLFGTMFCRF